MKTSTLRICVHTYVRTCLNYVQYRSNVALAQQLSNSTLYLDVYHLKSASLQLKNHSTLGLQQNFYARYSSSAMS